MQNGVRCTWHLNRDCNFKCTYCYVSKARDLKGQRGHGADKDIAAFKKNAINWSSILMSGGEPFMYPRYVELCKKLTAFSDIEINTNCSTPNVYDFADTIDPKKVREFHVSLHLGQRPESRWEPLADKVTYLQEKGFPVRVTEVLHPTLISGYTEAYAYFKKKGICVVPKVFEGIYNYRMYPPAYSQSQREFFRKKSRACNEEPPALLDGFLDWSGKTCDAGYRFFQIQYNGDAFRCQAEKTYLGNLYAGDITLDKRPRACNTPICTCAYEGLQHAHGKPQIHTRTPFKEYALKTGEYLLGKLR